MSALRRKKQSESGEPPRDDGVKASDESVVERELQHELDRRGLRDYGHGLDSETRPTYIGTNAERPASFVVESSATPHPVPRFTDADEALEARLKEKLAGHLPPDENDVEEPADKQSQSQ